MDSFTSSAVLVVIAIILSLVGICIAIHNGIIANANRIRRSWADVITYQRQKTNILDGLTPHLKGYTDYESGLLKSITSLRSQISELPATPDNASLASVQNNTQALLGGLRVAFEAYPTLEASKILSNVMREIVEQEENIGASIQIYNASVEYFNNSIQTVFGSLINRMFTGKQEAESFSDSKAASNFEFAPKLP
ncbi:MAG: LemA family protein [Hafnia sp.]